MNLVIVLSLLCLSLGTAIDLNFTDCGLGEIVHFRAKNAISQPYTVGPGDEIDIEIKLIPKVCNQYQS